MVSPSFFWYRRMCLWPSSVAIGVFLIDLLMRQVHGQSVILISVPLHDSGQVQYQVWKTWTNGSKLSQTERCFVFPSLDFRCSLALWMRGFTFEHWKLCACIFGKSYKSLVACLTSKPPLLTSPAGLLFITMIRMEKIFAFLCILSLTQTCYYAWLRNQWADDCDEWRQPGMWVICFSFLSLRIMHIIWVNSSVSQTGRNHLRGELKSYRLISH